MFGFTRKNIIKELLYPLKKLEKRNKSLPFKLIVCTYCVAAQIAPNLSNLPVMIIESDKSSVVVM